MVDEGHPLSAGVVGYFMGRRAVARYNRPLIDAADVILFVGARTNQSGTDSWKLFPRDAHYIHIDMDPQEVGRNYEALRLVGDIDATLEPLVEELAKRDLRKRSAARNAVASDILRGRKAHIAKAESVVGSNAQPTRPERVMAELDRRLTAESIVVADASYSSILTLNYLRSRRAGMRFLTPRGIAGLGWGLPFAIGARVAAPDAPVFCVVGDGGFGHVWSELETARRMGLQLVVMVLNNQILGYQAHAEDLLFGGHTDACAFGPVDHAAIARACGCQGERIEGPSEIGDALDRARSRQETTVLDIITDPAAFPPITLYDTAAPQGGMS